MLAVMEEIFMVGGFIRRKRAKLEEKRLDEELAADGEVYDSDEEEKLAKGEEEEGI